MPIQLSGIKVFLIEYKNYVLTIIATGYIVYFNSFFNGFVLDDLFQIVNNPNIVGWHNLTYFFTHEMGPYYRPLMLTTFSLFYNLGLGSFFYHFFQITIHIINTLMVFSFIDYILNRKKTSLFLSLVFLTHPIVVESVVYSSQLQETYFMFFGLLGLHVIKNGLSNKTVFVFLPFLQVLGLLSKETAILFILMQGFLTVLVQKKYIIKQLLSSFVVLLVYIAWRLLLFGSISPHKFQTIIPNSPGASDLVQRLINIPSIILFYLKTFLFPQDLAVSQLWWNKSIQINNFYIPLLFDLLFLLILVIPGVYIYKKKLEVFHWYFFFLLWILIGLGFHSQIISLDWTVAERWFYFPIIGLLGLIGVVTKNKEIKNEKTRVILSILFSLIIFSLSIRTIVRNTNWYSQLTLTSHDIHISKNSGDLELNLGVALNSAGRYDEAIKHLEKAAKLIPEGHTVWDNLGASYANAKKYNYATASFKKAIEIEPDYKLAYVHLVRVYILDLRGHEAKRLLEMQALKRWPSEAFFWRMLGYANILIKDKKEALRAFEKAYELSPDELNTYYYVNLKEKKEVMLRM